MDKTVVMPNSIEEQVELSGAHNTVDGMANAPMSVIQASVVYLVLVRSSLN